MKTAHMLVVCLAVSAAPAALAQKWELGGAGGYGFYLPKDATRPTETATTKITPGVSGAAWLGNNTGVRWGGEIRYAYERGDLQLKQGSTEVNFNSETHSIHYDFQYHFSDVDSSSRPYLAFGGGVKVYRGTGTEQLSQPLSRFALLTRTQEVQGMLSLGAGIKTKINDHWQFRVDFHDYITPFPSQVIAPNLGTHIGGMMHNFVPMVGISWTH
jgi:opacity protein-like surface antigen